MEIVLSLRNVRFLAFQLKNDEKFRLTLQRWSDQSNDFTLHSIVITSQTIQQSTINIQNGHHSLNNNNSKKLNDELWWRCTVHITTQQMTATTAGTLWTLFSMNMVWCYAYHFIMRNFYFFSEVNGFLQIERNSYALRLDTHLHTYIQYRIQSRNHLHPRPMIFRQFSFALNKWEMMLFNLAIRFLWAMH